MKKEIEQSIEDIEARQNLLIDALLQLIDHLKVEYDSFSILALVAGLSACEVNTIENIFNICSSNLLSKREVFTLFNEKLPNRIDMLPVIAKGFRAENKFLHAAKVILADDG